MNAKSCVEFVLQAMNNVDDEYLNVKIAVDYVGHKEVKRRERVYAYELYIAEKQRLEHELQKQRQRALELEKRIKICDAQMERMRGILNQNEFDEELVHGLSFLDSGS